MAALLAVQVLFGIWPVVGVQVLEHVSPRVLVGVRVAVAAPILFALARPWRTAMPFRDLASFALLGFLGVALNQVLFVEGLHRSTPINAAVLGCLIPAYTVGVAVLLRHERARRRRLVGLAVAMAGALFLVGVEQIDLGRERLVGNLLLTGNTLVYSIYLVLARPLVERYGALTVVGHVFAFAALFTLPYAGPDMLAFDWAALPDVAWAGLAFIVFGATLGAYLLNAYALRLVPASTVAVFVYLQPLITGAAARRVLGQTPGWQVVVAAALIFAGVALVSHKPLPRPSRT